MKISFLVCCNVFLCCACLTVIGCDYAHGMSDISREVPSRVSSENNKYLDLLVECQNDRIGSNRLVTIQIITNLVDSFLISKYESPLNQLANAAIDHVVWYGDIVVSNIVNTCCYTQKLNQVCDISCWLIVGFRKEIYSECKIAAISYENTLIQAAFCEDIINPSLCAVFARDWLSNTAAFIEYKCNNLKALYERDGVAKSMDFEFMQIIKKIKRTEKCDYVKLLECTKALRMQIEDAPPSFYSKQLSFLIDKLLIPDLELHILKQKRRLAESCVAHPGAGQVENR